jgi:hypothetical protein
MWAKRKAVQRFQNMVASPTSASSNAETLSKNLEPTHEITDSKTFIFLKWEAIYLCVFILFHKRV